jgi:hypothetical protein
VKEHPILMSAPMVRAILEGRKTMTRRVVMPAVHLIATDDRHAVTDSYCPYGAPGERLWVRETWCCYTPELRNPKYRADRHNDSGWTWRPSIHMPRWASRLTLEVTAVRVERLKEISEEDARAEGVEQCEGGYIDAMCGPSQGMEAKQAFDSLWDSINAARGFGWSVNPWVWVVSFRRVEVAR